MFTGYLWRHFIDKTCKGNKKKYKPGRRKNPGLYYSILYRVCEGYINNIGTFISISFISYIINNVKIKITVKIKIYRKK